MKLATVEDIQNRMGVNADVINTDAAEAALESATPVIEGILGTQLNKQDTLDFFDFRPSKYFDASRFIQLKLVCERGLFRDPPEVYLSESGDALTAPVSSLKLVDTSYTYDADQGVVTLLVVPKIGAHTIIVSYVSGFSDEDPKIPYWLKEAAISSSLVNMGMYGLQHNRKDLRDNIPYQNANLRTNLHRYIRTREGLFPAASRKA